MAEGRGCEVVPGDECDGSRDVYERVDAVEEGDEIGVAV